MPGGELLVHDVAEDATFLVGEVMPRPFDFLADEIRHDRQGDELRMRMLERRARGPSVILEQQDVPEAKVLLQVAHALAKR